MNHPTDVADRTGQIWFRGELIYWPAEPFAAYEVAETTELRTQKQVEDWARRELAEHPADMVQLYAGLYDEHQAFAVQHRADVLDGKTPIGWWLAR